MGIKFANNAQTLLNGSISDSQTSITVDDGSVFPTLGGSDYCYLSIDSEIVKCTAIATNTLTIVRAQEGTIAAAHSDNARVQQNVTAASLNDLAQETDSLAELSGTLDDITDGATYVKMSATEQAKLSGIEASADVTDSTNVLAALVGQSLDTGTVTADGLTVDGSSTFDDIKLTAVALPAAGNPSIALRNTDNNVYIQSGSGNAFTLLDSSQNTMLRATPTSHALTISNGPAFSINSGRDISFYEATGNTPKLVWKAGDERLGIGTGSPNHKVDIVGSSENLLELTSSGSFGTALNITQNTPSTSILVNSTSTGDIVDLRDNGTTVFTVKDGGNVGIGTSSPDADLTINKDSGLSARITIDSGANNQGDLLFKEDGTNKFNVAYDGNANHFKIYNYVQGSSSLVITDSGNLLVGTTSSSVINERLTINGNGMVIQSAASTNRGMLGNFGGSNFIVGSYDSIPLEFRTGNTEAMRIDSSGNLDFGGTGDPATTGNMVRIGPNGRIAAAKDGSASLKLYRQNNDAGGVAEFYYNTTPVGSISVTASATAYNTSSDYRLKEDDQPMVNSIDRLKQLRPVNFAWKADGTRVDGFLAHEAQTVVPEAVTGTKDAMRTEEYEVTPAVEATYDEEGNELTAAVEAVMGTREVPDYQGIDQSKLVPLLVSAIQELTAKVEALENAQ